MEQQGDIGFDKDLDEEEEEEEIGDNVIHANNCVDPFTLDGSHSTFNCKDSSIAVLRHFKVESLSEKLLNWTMDLLETNMKDMYNECSWGWKRTEKKEEMTEESARFLIAFVNEQPVAFSHFRFDMDYGYEVVYCYEIQIESHARHLGLGGHLMRTLENFSRLFNLTKVVLTVFKHNLNGIGFFKTMGYEIDETSPGPEEGKCYDVLSKKVLKAS